MKPEIGYDRDRKTYTRNNKPITAAARALRAIPSESRTAASRENGKKGGRPKAIALSRAEASAALEAIGCWTSDPDIPKQQLGRNARYLFSAEQKLSQFLKG